METIEIKLWDGIRIITETENEIVEGPADLWKTFGWDIENDTDAKECATIITRELFCFGQIDLTQMNHGNLLFLKVVPAKN